MYFQQGRYAESAAMFEKALQLNDHDARVWRNLGDAYYWTPAPNVTKPRQPTHAPPDYSTPSARSIHRIRN